MSVRRFGRTRTAVATIVALCCFGVLALVADARPGGGHTYSGGGGGGYSSGGGGYSSGGGGYSSSGGGGGTAGAGVAVLMGVALMVLLIAAAADARRRRSYTTTPSAPIPPPKLDLSPVTAPDPDFSRAVFEDFAYRLYAAAHRARDRDELAKLTPYVGPSALDVLARRSGRIDHVVIGNLRIAAVHEGGDPQLVRVVVAIEANLATTAGTMNVSERWTFARSPETRSRPPEKTRTFACPSCNAPFRAGGDPRTCAHCGEAIDVGRFDWTVTAIQIDATTDVGPTLTGTVEEVGNDFPTLTDATAHEHLMALRTDDPNVTWHAFASRVEMIYARLNDAWNAQDLTPVRGLVTSSLLQYLQFWIDEYKRQGLTNKLDDAAIKYLALAKVTRDRWYDAITVRVFADGHDYTLKDSGALVGGSRDKRRDYTEYWTFLRSSARRGPVTTEPRCPNCGAPLAISDAGACTHCNAEIENASFDWTLSKIEQDDVYRG